MKKGDLKKKILETYKSDTPDLRSRVLASCENERQEPTVQSVYKPTGRPSFYTVFKRVAAFCICLVLFISGLSIGRYIPREDGGLPPAAAETFVYLDVNPSIELQIDGEDKIVACIAANTDAEAILTGLKLDGVDMNTALTAIVGSMYVNGYLTEESNSILISVDSKDDAKTQALLTSISDKINNVFDKTDMECSIIAQGVSVDDSLKQRAEDNSISVGKMYLVDKMIESIEDYGSDDAPTLTEMSIKELNLIYSTRPEKGGENDPFDKDVSHGEIGGFIKQDDALTSLLASVEIDISNVEDYEIKVDINHSHSNSQMVYTLMLKLKNDENIYEFKVDCKNGNIVKTDERLPNRDGGRTDNPGGNKGNR